MHICYTWINSVVLHIIGINPLDNMRVHELRVELEKRGLATAGKKRQELEKDFDELRRGIVNVPALLQGCPETNVGHLCLDKYEISPVEPLHDVKGHLNNLIDEIRPLLKGEAKKRVDVIANSVLGKETLRCSDYRKGAILMLKALQETIPDSPLTAMLSTAVEITELLYSRQENQTKQSVLRLHNLAFVHAKLCSDHLSNPKTMSRRKMFGRYFHAITTHSPLLNRIIPPRLLNTELEERMFGQCKAITRTTSNQHTSNIISNILVRMHYEKQRREINTFHKQDSEIMRLSEVLQGKKNTLIPHEWMEKCSVHYQAHLERISDFLVHGPGVWWKYTQLGVEFFDVSGIPTQTVSTHHFRTHSLQDVDVYLLSKWEQCIDLAVQLPARHIRTYKTQGELNTIASTMCTLNMECIQTNTTLSQCDTGVESHTTLSQCDTGVESHTTLSQCDAGVESHTTLSQCDTGVKSHTTLSQCDTGVESHTTLSESHTTLSQCDTGVESHTTLSQCDTGVESHTTLSESHTTLSQCDTGVESHTTLSQCDTGVESHTTLSESHTTLSQCDAGVESHTTLSQCDTGVESHTTLSESHTTLSQCDTGVKSHTTLSQCDAGVKSHTTLSQCDTGVESHTTLSQCDAGVESHTTLSESHTTLSQCDAGVESHTTLSESHTTLSQCDTGVKSHTTLSQCDAGLEPITEKECQKVGNFCSLTKSLLQVTPKHMHRKILEFGQLRKRVKLAKGNNRLHFKKKAQYQILSHKIKEDLTYLLKQNRKKISQVQDLTPSTCKQLQHENKRLQKILAHEWKISIPR